MISNETARYSEGLKESPALVLFDIDGTLIRRAGPHHRQVLVEAVRRVTGIETSTEAIPVAGMLDRDILTMMLRREGLSGRAIRSHLPAIVQRAQFLYSRCCPDLQRKVCPGVRRLLARLNKRGVTTGLVTGNLSRIGWKKMERAGLKHCFRFGAFVEHGASRAHLVRIAIAEARRRGWVARHARISLIGDHPNDIRAARSNHIQAIAVATGLEPASELALHAPDVLVEDLRALPLEALLPSK